ncbi:MAG TPA: hypothetical protein VFA15_04755, partial [Nitrososphaera sp.]|nr:hypothetical protein [Nitrososphaera sp.]
IRNDQARNAAENLGKLESQRDQRSNELTSLVSEMKTAAAQASFLEEHNRYLSKITASPQTQEWMLQTKQAFEKRADRHREAISRLMQLQQECIARQQEMQQAQEKETEAEQKVAAEREAERQIEQELLSFAEQVLADYVKWGSTLVWLRAEDSSVLAEAMAKWLETGLAADWTLPSILERAVKHAEGDRRSELAQVEKKIEDIEQKIVALKSEQNDLEMGKHVPPFAPKTRDLDVREQIKGAPLWRVCDFRDHLDHVAQAGLEAALESAGLLDALITQEGAIHFPEAYDTFLAGAEIVVPKDSLGLWLSPSLSVNGSQLLTAASIEKALQHVGAGAGNGNHWVNTDGEWQLGPVRGRGRKEAAEHLGQAAREAARRRRISEIQEELALQDVELQKAKNIQEQLNTTRVRAIAEERDRAPTDEHIVMGLVRRSTTRERLVEARRNYETCQSIKAEAQKNLQNALEKRERESVDLQLAQWQEKPELLHDRWQNYRLLLGGLWPTARLRDDACKQVESASASLEQCREEAFIAKQRFADAESKWTEAYSRYNTLNENTGASVAELHSQTKAAKNKLEKAHKQFNEATEALIQAKGEQVAAQQQVQQLNDEITTIMNERVAAIDKLQLLAKHNLFPDAHSTFGVFEAEPWSVTRAIEIAREVEKTLRDTRSDDEAWRHQQTILFQRFTELQTALGTHGHQPQMEYADDSLVAISCP